jgi:hypothetical protein
MLENQTQQKLVLVQDLGMMYAKATSKEKRRYGLYKCPLCMSDFKTITSSVKSGQTKSCGCNKNKKHGLYHHPLFKKWKNMIHRTTSKKHDSYVNYTLRGITVCDRWLDVANFIEDMYPTYRDGLSLDRIDNNGNYEPSNCRWTTFEVQSRNQRILSSANSSGYRGVFFDNRSKKWIAKIQISRKQKHIGVFSNVLDGAKAYDRYVIENNLEHTINGVPQ